MDTGWADVYAGQYRRLVGLLTALAGSQAEAEEAVQEAFVRALGLTGRRAVVDDPEAWLYRVAVNVLRSRWRRVLAGRRATERLAPPDERTDALTDRVDSRMELLQAMRRMPFVQREALALHYLADLPLETIAARLGIPLGTVKARLSRGRATLAQLLTEQSVSEPGSGSPARKGDTRA